MSQTPHEFWRAIPAVTPEHTAGSHFNSRKIMSLTLPARWGPIPLHCLQSKSVFPIKHRRRLDFLDGTPESPQEHCHKSRGTLKSPQQHKRALCTTNQLKMRPDSPALAPEPSHVPHQTRQVAWLPLGNSRDSLRTPSQVERSTKSSTATRGKLRVPQIISRWELLPWLRLKRNANFPQAPQEETSLSYSYVRGTLSLLLKWNGDRDALTRNKARFPCSDLNAGSSFISQDEGMSESPP